MVFEPGDGVAGLEAVERPQQLTAATGIVFDQLFGFETGMSHVAAAATRDAHFLQDFASFFQDEDPAAGPQLPHPDGGEKAGRAAAHHDEVVFFFFGKLARTRHAQDLMKRRVPKRCPAMTCTK